MGIYRQLTWSRLNICFRITHLNLGRRIRNNINEVIQTNEFVVLKRVDGASITSDMI